MCGIAGSINIPFSNADLEQIRHRGPDSRGYNELRIGNDRIWLGHTRLSILELSSAGAQPMFTDCGQYCISFNGEIYNHNELRSRLKNINFKGSSDTETILYYLRENGISGVNDFNGIFAFAFLDIKQQKLYLVRDHFGVKPLYYFVSNHGLIFSSEIKLIKNNEAYNPAIDLTALSSFLTFRYNPGSRTMFDGILKLEAGHYLSYNLNGQILVQNYFKRRQTISWPISDEDATEEYKRLLNQAVSRQLLSDVPVGLLLSGGLDSAVLGRLMSDISPYKIKTFTVGFPGKGRFNETSEARSTSQAINSEHHELFISKDEYLTAYHNSFYYTEEPIAEPTIPALYWISKLASTQVKVVISGQGADEPMAGYKRYIGEKYLSLYGPLLRKLPLNTLKRFLPSSHLLDRGLFASSFSNEFSRFIGIYTLFTPEVKYSLFNDCYRSLSNVNDTSAFERVYKYTDPNADSLSRLLYLDTRTMLPDNLLLFNDKMTMANSIENRVPFLDRDLVEFVETLPVKFKLRGNTTKYIHRQAAKSIIPGEIINRKKRAFETPVGEWFREELAATLHDLVDDSNSLSRTFFDINVIRRMINLHTSNVKDLKKELFILLSLELWYKNFYSSSN